MGVGPTLNPTLPYTWLRPGFGAEAHALMCGFLLTKIILSYKESRTTILIIVQASTLHSPARPGHKSGFHVTLHLPALGTRNQASTFPRPKTRSLSPKLYVLLMWLPIDQNHFVVQGIKDHYIDNRSGIYITKPSPTRTQIRLPCHFAPSCARYS